MTSQFSYRTSSLNYFIVVGFLLLSLVTGSSFMSISWLVLDLWQFPFIKGWPEIRKSELLPSQFFPISGDWGSLGISNLARMSLVKLYWTLQNVRFTVFTVFELFRENQLGWRGVKTRLMKVGSTLMKYVHTPLAKIVLVPLGLTATALATDAAHFIKCHNFTLFPGVQILWKSTVSVALQAIFLKLCQNCAFPQISTTGNEVKLHYFMLWLIKITFLDQVWLR